MVCGRKHYTQGGIYISLAAPKPRIAVETGEKKASTMADFEDNGINVDDWMNQ